MAGAGQSTPFCHAKGGMMTRVAWLFFQPNQPYLASSFFRSFSGVEMGPML